MNAGAGRACLVTGASSGIGFAIARMLATKGYALTIGGRREDRPDAAAEVLRATGASVTAVAGDLATAEGARHLVDRHAEQHGRVDVLVNNAGRGIATGLEQLEDRYVDLQLDLNLASVIRVTKWCLPMLREARDDVGVAQVFNVASVAGKVGQRGLAVYSAAKHGVVGFTEAMNRELSAGGIRSTVLCPALVDTPLTEPFRDRIGPDEMIKVDDVSDAVRYVLGVTRFCLIPEIVLLRPGADWGE